MLPQQLRFLVLFFSFVNQSTSFATMSGTSSLNSVCTFLCSAVASNQPQSDILSLSLAMKHAALSVWAVTAQNQKYLSSHSFTLFTPTAWGTKRIDLLSCVTSMNLHITQSYPRTQGAFLRSLLCFALQSWRFRLRASSALWRANFLYFLVKAAHPSRRHMWRDKQISAQDGGNNPILGVLKGFSMRLCRLWLRWKGAFFLSRVVLPRGGTFSAC